MNNNNVFNPLKTEIRLICRTVQKFCSYFIENTLRIHYESLSPIAAQEIALQENCRCLLYHTNVTNKC